MNSAGKALVPKSRIGQVLLMLFVAYLLWLAVKDPAAAWDTVKGIAAAIDHLFESIRQAQEAA